MNRVEFDIWMSHKITEKKSQLLTNVIFLIVV